MVRTSKVIFRDRLEFLVERSSEQDVADFYGVTKRTVRRWRDEETTPSQRVRESVRRRGRRAGAERAVQLRNRGRFTTAADTGTRRVRVGIERERRRVRAAAIDSARMTGNDAALRIARRIPVRLSQEEVEAITQRRLDLQEGLSDETWDSWRSDYDILKAGGSV